MSDVGLNSNIFHSTRKYLDLLINFLVDINYSKETRNNYTNQNVINFFKDINYRNNQSPEIQFLYSIFLRHYNQNRQILKDKLDLFCKSTEAGNYDEKMIKEIEELISVLKYHFNRSYARIIGNEY